MTRFHGRAAIVTGAASGIGLAIARRLASEGAAVALIDKSEVALRDAASALATEGATVISTVADVSEAANFCEALSGAVQRLGQLDILVNSAGVIARGAIEDTSPEEWQRVLAINLSSMYHAARATASFLKKTQGAIVNVASVSASRGGVNIAYEASKGGVVAMTRQLANELGPYGVRVNSLSPGFTATPLNADLRASGAELRWRKHIPLGRYGRPEEVASACAFLASTDASFITAIDLVVDGGHSNTLRPDTTLDTTPDTA